VGANNPAPHRPRGQGAHAPCTSASPSCRCRQTRLGCRPKSPGSPCGLQIWLWAGWQLLRRQDNSGLHRKSSPPAAIADVACFKPGTEREQGSKTCPSLTLANHQHHFTLLRHANRDADGCIKECSRELGVDRAGRSLGAASKQTWGSPLRATLPHLNRPCPALPCPALAASLCICVHQQRALT